MEREKCIKELLKVKSLSDTLLNFETMLRDMSDRNLKDFHRRFADTSQKPNDNPRRTRG